MIEPPPKQESPSIVYHKFLPTMIDDVCTRGGQSTEEMPNNRLLPAKTSQESTTTNTEATYWWITYITNARAH